MREDRLGGGEDRRAVVTERLERTARGEAFELAAVEQPRIDAVGEILERFFQSSSQGAIPTLFAATAPGAMPGGYYGPQSFFELRGGGALPAKIAPQAHMEVDATRLWTVCEDLTNVRYL